MEGTSYEDEYVKFTFQDGILFGKNKVNKIDLRIAKHMTETRLKKFNDGDYPIFADYTLVNETSKEARDYFASPEQSKRAKAVAVLSNSKIINMIFNFYIILSKPNVPTKLFSDKEEALRWLRTYL